ncbi:MAG: hypothetical protein IIA60_05555 [Candidatus Marinimicrobia bacterium]|nr:hypothetical protein [Candidatus Neomarinimicrobiota bacterium]
MRQFYMVLDKKTVLQGSDIKGEDRIEFSELPEEMTLTRSANYIDIDIIGRSEPLKSYANSPSTTFDFNVKLVAVGNALDAGAGNISGLSKFGQAALASGLVAGGARGAVQQLGVSGFTGSPLDSIADAGAGKAAFLELEVHQKARWIEALTYAQYDKQGRAFPPPAFFLIYGRNFARRCVLRSVTEIYKGPWDVTNLLTHVVELSITAEEVNAIPKSYQDARNGVTTFDSGPFDARFPATGAIATAAVATVSRFIF